MASALRPARIGRSPPATARRATSSPVYPFAPYSNQSTAITVTRTDGAILPGGIWSRQEVRALHVVEVWFAALPPILIYLLVGLVIGVESMGIPVPGEVTLVTASLLSAKGIIDPWIVGLAGSIGAITGDS